MVGTIRIIKQIVQFKEETFHQLVPTVAGIKELNLQNLLADNDCGNFAFKFFKSIPLIFLQRSPLRNVPVVEQLDIINHCRRLLFLPV